MEFRKIIHIDMDAFFASVEQRNNPALRGKPVIVGGKPGKRGVVAACSYEARRYGIHSAMASTVAARLCPGAIFVHGNFDEYAAVSGQIRDIFHRYTDLVEPMSLDEAYLDVTVNRAGSPSATNIAREIRAAIYDSTRLTASAGVSYNKFLAKAASDYRKPNGITVVTPQLASEFIDRLPIGNFYGIGKVTEKKMLQIGVRNGSDLKKISRVDLVRLFGKSGDYYYLIAHGLDERPVEPYSERKSMGREVTLEHDLYDMGAILAVLDTLSLSVARSLDKGGYRGRTITLKIRYDDFTTVSRSATLDEPCVDAEMIFMQSGNLIRKTEAGSRKVRLIGISLSNFKDDDRQGVDRQLLLPFDV